MAHWLETYVLPSVIAAVVLLLVLWPTSSSGRRLLRTWGVPQPRPEQVAEAVRYLRQRRLLQVLFFLVLPPLAGLAGGERLPGIGLLVPLLAAMLVAEAVATLRPVSGVRTASLDPRSRRDLLPRWTVPVLAAGAGVTAVLAVVGIAAGAWLVWLAWLALGYAVACPLLVGGLVALAVRRPAVDDEVVDAALRTRTARVAAGIGFGWLAIALGLAVGRLRSLTFATSEPVARPAWLTPEVVDVLDVGESVVVVGMVVCWLWVALPSRKSLVAR